MITEAYVHRIGRTGRAGREGDAILFVAPREKRLLGAIEKATRKKIEMMELPSTELINDKRIAQFKQRITDTLAAEDLFIFYPAESNNTSRNIMYRQRRLPPPLPNCYKVTPHFYCSTNRHRRQTRAGKKTRGHEIKNTDAKTVIAPQEKTVTHEKTVIPETVDQKQAWIVTA